MLHDLHRKICEEIKASIPEIQACCSYPRMRCELIAPACFIEIESFDVGTDPGTEECALVANFEARVVLRQELSWIEPLTELILRYVNLP